MRKQVELRGSRADALLVYLTESSSEFVVSLNKASELVRMSSGSLCLLYHILAAKPFKLKPGIVGIFFLLLFFQKSNRLYQVSVGQCLRVVDPLSHKGYVAMAICDGSSSQQWHLEG